MQSLPAALPAEDRYIGVFHVLRASLQMRRPRRVIKLKAGVSRPISRDRLIAPPELAKV